MDLCNRSVLPGYLTSLYFLCCICVIVFYLPGNHLITSFEQADLNILYTVVQRAVYNPVITPATKKHLPTLCCSAAVNNFFHSQLLIEWDVVHVEPQEKWLAVKAMEAAAQEVVIG